MAKYSVNFYPLSIEGKTSILVGQQSYNKKRLRDLQQKFSHTHILKRNDDTIIDVPIKADSAPIRKLQKHIDLTQDRILLPSLFSAALMKIFSGSRDIVSDRPVTVLGGKSRSMISHTLLPGWIQKRTIFRFDTRSIYRTHRQLGIVCDAKSKNLILGTCADLLAKNVSLEGKYVQIEEDPFDSRLMKRRRLVGKIKRVRGDTLLLEDNVEGYKSIAAKKAFLEGRREVLNDCVMQILGKDADDVIAQAEDCEAKFHSGPERKKQIETTLEYLRKQDLKVAPGVKIRIGKMFSSGDADSPTTRMIPKPFLVFDPSGTRKDSWAERGIKDYGPYDQRTFSPKQLNIAVICQARHEKQVNGFVAKFLDGIPNVVSGKNNVARYDDGFLRRYNLERHNLAFLQHGRLQ